ncbi:MAG TPA: energy transducer TonB [Candidatus Angelobacter sp.]|nr:energy transducer TonB [Candidatus Angelobacter sp.]
MAIVAVACAAQQSTDSASPSMVQLSPAEADKLLIARVVPQYPEVGIANQIQNNELVSLQVDEQGNVADAKVKGGHPAFAQPSLDAVKQWKYHPYLVNDSPVRFETTALIAYRFFGSKNIPSMKEPLISVVAMLPATGVPESRPLQVGSYQLEGLLVNRVDPQYPEMAKSQRIQGDVVLYVHVDKRGHVTNVDAVSGRSALLPAAIDAVKQWTYKPFEVGGETVEVEGTVLVPFRLDDSTEKQQSENQ